MFVRHDAVRKPLQPPYDGPFRIIKRTDKHFTLDLNGRHDTVSIDRLKPAHIEFRSSTNNTNTTTYTPTVNLNTQSPSQTPPPTVSPTRSTRSGRRVHFPTYLSHSVS